MLSCSNCDASLKLNAKLCIKCGHIVTDEERESAVTGVPLKKPVATSEVIAQEVVTSEPVMIPDEKTYEIESTVELVSSGGFTDLRPLTSDSAEKLNAAISTDIPAANEENSQNLRLVEENNLEPKLEKSISSIPKNIPSEVKNESSNQEGKTKSTNSPAQSNSKLIGMALAGVAVVVVSGFLFMGGDKASKTPVVNSMPIESKEAPVVVPVSESQPAPQVKVEPPVTQSVPPSAERPVHKSKSSNQQSDAPVAIPDLNKLVKDAINK